MGNKRARRPLIAANWKMNGLRSFGLDLVGEIAARAAGASSDTEILICPPATLLFPIGAALAGGKISLGGQDCHAKNAGPFTGDIAAPMLKDAGCSHVIVGHSERRTLHRETDGTVLAKASAALAAGLIAVICVGETESQRVSGDALEVVRGQITNSVPANATPETIVVAYEPVWAIGTGRVPTLEEIKAMHNFIRTILTAMIDRGQETRVLYGGSVNAGNAAEILAVADVDGALVGGASLKAADFWTIVSAVPQ